MNEEQLHLALINCRIMQMHENACLLEGDKRIATRTNTLTPFYRPNSERALRVMAFMAVTSAQICSIGSFVRRRECKNWIEMKIPNTVSANTIKAYASIDLSDHPHWPTSDKRLINAANFQWTSHNLPSLRELCIKALSIHWHLNPIYAEINDIEDKNSLLDVIDVRLPIKLLSTYIFEDVFWQRCFQHRWPSYYPPRIDRPWINLYLERHLAEAIEHLKPINFDEEDMKALLETCSPHVRTLKIRQLQPSLADPNYHIPFEGILANLAELRTIDLTYDLKTIGPHDFFLGCTNVARQDIESLALGIEKCYELVEFRLHSTKMDPFMLELIANALDKSCSKLESIEFAHCGISDEGLKSFTKNLNQESFQHLKHLILINNYFSE